MNRHLLTSICAVAMVVIATAQTAAAVPAGAVDGALRVSESRYVNFARGNLQYTTSTDTANITTDTEGNKVPADEVDLFAWGLSAAKYAAY